MIAQCLHRCLSALKYGLIVGITLVGITETGSATATSPRSLSPVHRAKAANDTASRVEAVGCSTFAGFEVSDAKVECGYLTVPENRRNPKSRTIKVAYAIIKAASPNPQPDPIVFLSGGPGDRAIDSGWIKWPSASLAKRDLILVDPRGIGYSQPTMKCAWKTPPSTSIQDQPPSPEETHAYAVQWAVKCRDLLVSQGFDLVGYNSVANANDLADLRVALGYSEWNLYGISYGTSTALEILRGFPQGIRSVILDSPIPPQISRSTTDPVLRASALSSLFAACKADPPCSHEYPNLETEFDELLQRVAQSPIELSLRDPSSGEQDQIWLTGHTVFLAISQMLANPVFIRIAPITIEQIHAGNAKALQPLVPALMPTSNQAITYTVWCHDRASSFHPDDSQAAQERYPMLRAFFVEDEDFPICAVWGAGQEQAGELRPVSSEIPALVLTGRHDPLTPPAYAKLTASTLSHSYLYEFPAYGHAVSYNDCPKVMLAAFVDDPSSAPDSTCMAQIRERPFITDVYVNQGVFSLYTAVQLFDIRLSIALVLVELLFLSAIVALPVAYCLSRREGHKNSSLSNAARLVLWAVALSNVAFGVGAWLLVKQALAENYGWVTLFGFSPSSTGYLFILPWLGAVLTTPMLALTYLTWKRRWWGRAARLYYTVGALAAVGFSAFLVYSHVLSF